MGAVRGVSAVPLSDQDLSRVASGVPIDNMPRIAVEELGTSLVDSSAIRHNAGGNAYLISLKYFEAWRARQCTNRERCRLVEALERARAKGLVELSCYEFLYDEQPAKRSKLRDCNNCKASKPNSKTIPKVALEAREHESQLNGGDARIQARSSEYQIKLGVELSAMEEHHLIETSNLLPEQPAETSFTQTRVLSSHKRNIPNSCELPMSSNLLEQEGNSYYGQPSLVYAQETSSSCTPSLQNQTLETGIQELQRSEYSIDQTSEQSVHSSMHTSFQMDQSADQSKSRSVRPKRSSRNESVSAPVTPQATLTKQREKTGSSRSQRHNSETICPDLTTAIQHLELRSHSVQERRKNKIFITYAKDNKKHVKEVLKLVRFFKQNNFNVAIDMAEQQLIARDKLGWIDNRFHGADKVIAVVSPEYHQVVGGNDVSWRTDSPSNCFTPDGLNTRYIHRLMQTEYLNNRCTNYRVMPVIFPSSGATYKHLPKWLNNTLVYTWPDHARLMEMHAKDCYGYDPIMDFGT